VAALMGALNLSVEAAMLMDALLAMRLALGAGEWNERCVARAKAKASRGQVNEVVDLPGGGKSMRIRGMPIEKLGGFLKSQGLVEAKERDVV
jgi:hypothetical protein